MEAGTARETPTHICYDIAGSWLDEDIVQAKPGAMWDRKAGNLHWLHSQCRHDTPSSRAKRLRSFVSAFENHRGSRFIGQGVAQNQWSLIDVVCVPVWARMYQSLRTGDAGDDLVAPSNPFICT
jgi:hypothetical protein